MIRRFPRTYLAVVIMAAGMTLTATSAGSNKSQPAVCGLDLSPRDVFVLDVQHLLSDPEQSNDYVIERAGNYVLANPLIDEFRMPFRPPVDPDGVIRVARKFGVR